MNAFDVALASMEMSSCISLNNRQFQIDSIDDDRCALSVGPCSSFV